MFIPAITGKGRKDYRSIEQKPLVGFDGSVVGAATITPPILVNMTASKNASAPLSCSINSLLDIFRQAGNIFREGKADGLNPEEYVKCASLTSGLPISIVRRLTLDFFPEILPAMEQFLLLQSPGGLAVFDTYIYKVGEIQVGLVPRGRNAGFVMPGNHPSTHYMWLCALAMKIPVIVRPSYRDVFTPYRLVMSLLEAGLPEDALTFFPGTHELVDTITKATALTVVFGGQEIADRYAGDNHVKVYGPGRSKAVVLANADFNQAVDTVYHLIVDDGGRGCINCSAVIVEGDAQELIDAVSALLKQIPVISPLEEPAQLGAMTDIKEAESYNSLIDSHLSPDTKEWSSVPGGRIGKIGDATLMLPTVIEVPSFAHPLFGVELPFPFAVFTSANSRQEILAAAQNSLAVVVIGEDEYFSKKLLLEPSIDKVFVNGALSTKLDPREPHEGFILDFLFQKKAFQAGKMLEHNLVRNPAPLGVGLNKSI